MEACRTCLQLIDLKICLHHKIESPNAKLTTESNRYKILTIIPEMALNISSKSVLCDPCFSNIQSIFNFKTKCMQTESMIMRYINTRPYIDLKQIDLKEVAYLNNMGYVQKPVTNIEPNKEVHNSTASLDNITVKLEAPSEYEHEDTTSQSSSVCIDPENIPIIKHEVTDLATSAPTTTNSAVNETSEATISNSLILDSSKDASLEKSDHVSGINDSHAHEQISLEKLDNAFDINYSVNNIDKTFNINATTDMNVNWDNLVLNTTNDNMNVDLEKKYEGDMHISNDKINLSLDSDHMDNSELLFNQSNEDIIVEPDILKPMESTSNYSEEPLLPPGVQCPTCLKVFATKSRFECHYRTHTRETPYKCTLCPKAYTDASTLRKHLIIHSGIKQFACELCDSKFYDRGNLNKHMIVHTNVKPFKCEVCEKDFSRKEHLKKHRLTHTGEKHYECDICHKKYARKSVLMIHMSLHTGQRDYSCEYCNKGFYDSSTLRKHRLSHTGEKPYQCKICTRKYAQKTHLTIHERQHNGERPFVCEICNKSFTASQRLKNHMRSHSGEKPYECPVCKKRFSTLSNCFTHKKIHTGVKAFQCGHCHKNFTHKNDLKKHIMVHTEEKPFLCHICNRAFNRKIRARQHIQKMHKEVDITTVVIQRYKTTTITEEPIDVKFNINTEIIIKTENEIPCEDVKNDVNNETTSSN